MYTYQVTIKRVIDGDTVVVDVDLGFYLWKFDVYLRLLGIDTPERGQPGFDEATDFVKDFFKRNPKTIVRFHKKDSFGRWLVDIWDEENNTTLNAQLLEKNLAAPYLF